MDALLAEFGAAPAAAPAAEAAPAPGAEDSTADVAGGDAEGAEGAEGVRPGGSLLAAGGCLTAGQARDDRIPVPLTAFN